TPTRTCGGVSAPPTPPAPRTATPTAPRCGAARAATPDRSAAASGTDGTAGGPGGAGGGAAVPGTQARSVPEAVWFTPTPVAARHGRRRLVGRGCGSTNRTPRSRRLSPAAPASEPALGAPATGGTTTDRRSSTIVRFRPVFTVTLLRDARSVGLTDDCRRE